MAKKKKAQEGPYGGVSIGDVSGGIQGSIIAGGDVEGATVSYEALAAAEEAPTVEKLQELLAQIQGALAEVTAQQEALQQVSAAAPYTVQGAQQSIAAAAEAIEASPEMAPEQAKSVQQSLQEATGLLNGILEGAKTAAEKAVEVGQAVKPIAQALEPVLQTLAVAGTMVAKLWLGG
jgi:hypothetical protein